MMVLTMPLVWRPDQLVLLILNALLLGRAALVPSAPRRTAWISAASVAAMPIVTFLLFRTNPSRELLPGAVVTQATLWATFTFQPRDFEIRGIAAVSEANGLAARREPAGRARARHPPGDALSWPTQAWSQSFFSGQREQDRRRS